MNPNEIYLRVGMGSSPAHAIASRRHHIQECLTTPSGTARVPANPMTDEACVTANLTGCVSVSAIGVGSAAFLADQALPNGVRG